MSMFQEAYTIADIAQQDLQDPPRAQKKTVIILCKTTPYGQQEAQSVRCSPSDVSEEVSQYLRLHHTSASDYENFLARFNAEVESIPPDTAAVVYVFDSSAEAFFKLVEPPSSNEKPVNSFALSKFLSNIIWQHISNALATAPDVEIMLSSAQTRVHLQEFKDAVESLVEDGGIRAYVSAMGDMRRTTFWRNLIRVETSGRSDEDGYTYGSALFSDFDLPQLTPRNLGHTGSETSDSAEEGAHEHD